VFSVTTFCNVWLYWFTAFAFQKYAVAVSSGVRTVLFSAPYASVSFRSFA
jgi:myosin-crossreactive antigen